MAIWNKKPDPNTQLGDLPNATATEIAASYAEAERIYREGMIGAHNANMIANASIRDRRITYSEGQRVVYDVTSESYRRTMLGMRLHLREGEAMPFDSIHTSLGKEKVFVFVVQNDQAVTLEDERHMFPSDTLVTQLRLIAK